MLRCKRCHKEIAEDSGFCGYCGCKVEKIEVKEPECIVPIENDAAVIEEPEKTVIHDENVPIENNITEEKVACKKCGEEIDEDSMFCEYCGWKLEELELLEEKDSTVDIMADNQRVIYQKTAGVVVVALLIGCAIFNSYFSKTNNSNSNENTTDSVIAEEKNEGLEIVDDEIGLRNIKIDTTDTSLSEEQKQVVQYFDIDYINYINMSDYEFLCRYPNIFIGTQMSQEGGIYKILQQDNDSYEVLMGWGYNDYNIYIEDENMLSGWEYFDSKLVMLRGETGNAWFMENDSIAIKGRYTGIETVEVEGISYTVPVFDVHNCVIWSGREFDTYTNFTYNEVKDIAETIFGETITVSESTEGEIYSVFIEIPYYSVYTITLDNQSNDDFKKYLMTSAGGGIYDISIKSEYEWGGSISRVIEFLPDFQNYFLYTFDDSIEKLELAYYDTAFQKLWTREFEADARTIYEYTQNNIYLIANDILYIIDLQTGEDVVEPIYVGTQSDIRKLSDGILLINSGKSDGLIKYDLSGEIIWSADLSYDCSTWLDIQVADNNLVLGYRYKTGEINEYGFDSLATVYCLYDLDTGELLYSGETI